MNATTSSLALDGLKTERRGANRHRRVPLHSGFEFVTEADDKSSMEAFPCEGTSAIAEVVPIKGKVTVSF